MQIASVCRLSESILLRVVKEFICELVITSRAGHLEKCRTESSQPLDISVGHEVFYITPVAASEFNDPNVLVLNPVRSLSEKLLFKWNFEAAQYRVKRSQAWGFHDKFDSTSFAFMPADYIQVDSRWGHAAPETYGNSNIEGAGLDRAWLVLGARNRSLQ